MKKRGDSLTRAAGPHRQAPGLAGVPGTGAGGRGFHSYLSIKLECRAHPARLSSKHCWLFPPFIPTTTLRGGGAAGTFIIPILQRGTLRRLLPRPPQLASGRQAVAPRFSSVSLIPGSDPRVWPISPSSQASEGPPRGGLLGALSNHRPPIPCQEDSVFYCSAHRTFLNFCFSLIMLFVWSLGLPPPIITAINTHDGNFGKHRDLTL